MRWKPNMTEEEFNAGRNRDFADALKWVVVIIAGTAILGAGSIGFDWFVGLTSGVLHPIVAGIIWVFAYPLAFILAFGLWAHFRWRR